MKASGEHGVRAPYWKRLSVKTLLVIALLSTISWQPQLLVRTAAADTAVLADLTPSGWTRDTSLNGIKIDRYRTQTGSIALDLLAFPETTESARDWSVAFINHMLKPDLDAGMRMSLIDEDEMQAGSSTGAMTTSEPGLDMSTHTVVVGRPGKRSLIMRVRCMIREGEPVQVSLLSLPGIKATDAEYAQADRIAFDARLPVNASAAFLPLENMIELMTGGLIYPDSSETGQGAKGNHSSPTEEANDIAKAPAPGTSSSASAPGSENGKAPELRSMPGPRVTLSRGKILKSVPAGYRMEISATNYWTNESMTSTRKLRLKLTKDGQFEKSHFAITGGFGGVTGVVTTGDKHGSTGSVAGDTNPGGPGTRSMSLHTREGLDPTKYGVYYISGDTIELRHASGDITTHEFRTDGYYQFDLDGKRYFSSAPEGWERKTREKDALYRSIDGSYTARVLPLNTRVVDGKKLMSTWIQKLKEKSIITSATPLKFGEAGVYKYVRTVATYQSGDQRDLFLRYGYDSRQIEFTRYAGAKGMDVELDFVRYLD